MGYWLWQRIKTWTNVTDSDTQRLELAENALISSLRVVCVTKPDDTAKTAATVSARQWDDIDNFTVRGDEEDVIKNLSGREVLGLNLYDFRAPPAWQVTDERDGTEVIPYYLNFGLKPGDPEHALDTSRWGKVTLEIEHSFDVTDKTGYQTGTSDFDVWQLRRIGDLPGSNRGYFKTSRKYKWTGSATAGDWRESLPCKNPYRRIAIFCDEDAYGPGDGITDIELELNDGALKPFFGTPHRMCMEQTQLYGITPTFRHSIQTYAGATAQIYEHEVPYYQAIVIGVLGSEDNLQISNYANSLVYLKGTASATGTMLVTGDGFMGCMLIPFDLSGEADYLPSSEYSKIEVKIAEKVTRVPAMSVVLDELIA
uniref:Uncharacterized protein n=1 Tax=viral metagenome TaxID=1070528 RepID=A0A6M3XRW3_9ZZZZ